MIRLPNCSPLILALTLALVACGAPTPIDSQVTPPAVNPSPTPSSPTPSTPPAVTVSGGSYEGGVLTLDAGTQATATWLAGAVWTSDDTGVALVSVGADGAATIRGVGGGQTTLHARTSASLRQQGVSASSVDLKVSVRAPARVTEVRLSSSALSLSVGGGATLTASVTGSGTYSSAVSWSSSDQTVASVSAGGVVSALKVGQAVVTATSVADPIKRASATISVSAAGTTPSPTPTPSPAPTPTPTPTPGPTPAPAPTPTPTPSPTPTPTPTPTPSPTPSPSAGFHIDIVYPDSSLTTSQKQVFQDAAARWAQVITAALPSETGQLPSGGSVTTTGVTIEASSKAMDGVNGILGSAGPYALRRSDKLPLTGQMQFDSADMANMEQNGMLKNVILHEMGHVLGIGTLWDNYFKLLTYNASTCDASSTITYTGAHANARYQALGGSGTVPVETQYGSGTKCGHWSEAALKTELMTGFASQGSTPLSTITVGTLEDMGYTVNYAAADAYTLPLASAAVPQQSAGTMLRPTPYVVPGH